MLRGIALSLEPLVCRQMVIPRPECHFELRTDSDKVRLRLDALRKKWPRGILSVAFRTGKPNERLLELGSDEGVKTGVDLIDGYLLLANHIVHPVRLLADGAWHSLNLDLHSLSLRVDGQGTAISLVGGGSPVPSFRWMDILLVGEVAAVRVESAELEADEGHWICQTENGNAQDENEFINVHLNSAHHKHIFGLSPVCENERNFCNCKGRQPVAECAPSVASENAFHLSRVADRLAFFIVPNFGPRVPISVLLQSEEATGLVLFGVYTLATPSFGELGGRVQVHFLADTVFGSFCSTNTDGTERCLSCAIRRPRAFPSPDWHIFGLSPVCENERNFCNCKGRQPVAECAPSVASENAFHLSRVADRLAFFIVPNFGPRVPISVLLQSEEATGLVLFGVYTLATPSFGELGGRVQVHFLADTVFGSFCSTNTDGTERCLSCAIRRPRAFPSPDWVRFSLFHQQNLQFLAVDRQICVLSPNTDAVEAAELYKMTESNVLFVGGTFYAKGGARLGQRVSDSFRRQFQDNTREKAPSLQGCVAEIVVKGQPQNMDSLLLAQQQRATRHGKDGEEIFAMRKGCAECPTECRGAPCARMGGHDSQPECHCGEIYATTLGGSAANRRGGCVWADGTAQSAVGGGGIRLTIGGSLPSLQHDHELERPLSVPIRDPSTPRSRRRLRLNKVWTLLRMPETNTQLNTFVRIGGVQIAVGDNGRRLVVEAPEFAVREEFALHQPSDARLHLLSLEVTPSVGTAYAASSVTIRLNNERRRVVGLSEIPLAIGEQHQQQAVELRESVEIVPMNVPEGNNDAPGVEGGCVTALVFHYVPLDEGLLSNDQMSSPIHHHQVDYVPHAGWLLRRRSLPFAKNLPCTNRPTRDCTFCRWSRFPSFRCGLSEIPLAIGEQHQQQAVELRESVEIVPMNVPEGNNDAPGVEGGCVTALVFHYVPLDEGLLSNDQMSSPIHHHQVDYVPLLHVHLHNGNGTRPSLPVDRLNLQRCGVVDPTLWEGNSTSWGRTLEVDTSDTFFSGGIALFGRNAKWTRLSLLITTMLIIVILISLLLYGIVAAKRRHRQCEGLYNSKRSRCTDDRIERVKLVVEEKRPLRTLKDGLDDEEEEENNKSNYTIGTMAIPSLKQQPKSCMRNGGGKYVNGLDRQQQNVAAEREAQHILQFDDASLKMGIERLDGSPKHNKLSPAANDGFVATPLQAAQSTRRLMTPAATASLQQQLPPSVNPNGRNSSGTNLPGATTNASHNANANANSNNNRELIRQKAPVRALPNGHSPLPASGNNGRPQTQRQRQQSPNAPIVPKDEL
uniref:LAM_G_DOMAIN domain-containing protein n=1 Tax=Globodera pallida TaxID=36090 RepID=A0A183CCB1_GLOPA